jgi:hypothetical protein
LPEKRKINTRHIPLSLYCLGAQANWVIPTGVHSVMLLSQNTHRQRISKSFDAFCAFSARGLTSAKYTAAGHEYEIKTHPAASRVDRRTQTQHTAFEVGPIPAV